jgi:GTP-binding protein YchF
MLKAGIVGLPNVGKSTLFNAVTRTRKAHAANFPFCTIEPNLGIVNVPDERLEKLAALSKSQKIIPAAIEFVDIAGLVKGASKGEGLGNQFLSHIREVDAIVQVVRCFESANIHHVAGSIDPVRDIEVITTELILADLATVKKRAERLQKGARSGDKLAKAELALCEKIQPHLDSGAPALTARLSDEERTLLKGFFLLTSKPVILACNVGENELAQADNPHIPQSANSPPPRMPEQSDLPPFVWRLSLSAPKLRANWPNCRPKRLANFFLISVWQTAE